MASGIGRAIRQIRKTTADVKNEIVMDDTFRKPFEELRDAVTLAPEELKRRDDLIASVRKQAEELAREAAANPVEGGDGAATPPPEPVPVPPPTGSGSSPPEMSGAWPPPLASAPPPPPPPVTPVPPVTPPIGTFPRSPTPAPLPPGRLGGPQRVTPPFHSV